MQSEKVNIQIGKNIKARRKELGVSQRDLGRLVGVSFQQIQKYEAAKNGISVNRLYNIAVALNTPIDFFFKGTERSKQKMDKKILID